ncbi:putative Cytochrome c oxidase polypeptide Vc [Hibiscus syriacus]|uniref:Cytochrome c oxidase polypeptide Vc n=1 Tax=Hibiscus syriacus TaxID=106335 RepID=A0A6A3C455_HIBSY|nr:putative Cytochrome c oxidase polypeptide Vc [Hibiscus syriacus]
MRQVGRSGPSFTRLFHGRRRRGNPRIALDRPINRLLVAVADLLGNRYSALAAYDLSTWDRHFLTKLSGRVAGGPLSFGDGLELISPTKLVVAAGNPLGRLAECSDGWETASVVAKFKGPMHRLATAATVKDGKVYLNHMFGMGTPRRHMPLLSLFFNRFFMFQLVTFVFFSHVSMYLKMKTIIRFI